MRIESFEIWSRNGIGWNFYFVVFTLKTLTLHFKNTVFTKKSHVEIVYILVFRSIFVSQS